MNTNCCAITTDKFGVRWIEDHFLVARRAKDGVAYGDVQQGYIQIEKNAGTVIVREHARGFNSRFQVPHFADVVANDRDFGTLDP